MHHEGAWMEKRKDSFYTFLSLTLDEGEWLASCPGYALLSGKGHPELTGQDVGWAPRASKTKRPQEKSFGPARDQTPVIQSIVTQHTD
jgi:hypothetical protein